MTMTLHKISAGDGYTYLTRQVAAGDNTDRSRDSLAAYYAERGESSGRWTGRLAGGIGVEGEVSEAQMLALFGEGRHPDAARLEQAFVAAGGSPSDAVAKTRLGRPFAVYDIASQFPTALAKAYADHNTSRGLRSRAPIDDDERSQIRTRIARDMFADQYERPPSDARELSGWIARNTRPDKVAIAGYDLTFSPAKSVSVLWALAPRDVAERVAAAHDAAVAGVLARIETEAAYTRQGARGVRQVKVDGVIAAAFTHRSSRAGDPDLHTHVTISAKVRAPDDSWLTLDGRMLYKGNVTYSEMYNSALETELISRLPGLRFADVARTGVGGADKRPVRELVGLDASLLALMSKRAAVIEPRRAALAEQFVRDHGRTPTRPEQLALAQQATLDTREAKKEQRTHAQERAAWRQEAEAAVGLGGVAANLQRTLTMSPRRQDVVEINRNELIRRASARSLGAVTERRAVWQDWHVRAEAQRQVRRLVDQLDPAEVTSFETVQRLVDDVVDRTLADSEVVPLVAPDRAPTTPNALLNPDGRSQHTVFRAATFTTHATLAAEARIVAVAGRRDGRRADPGAVDTAVLESHANGKTLNTGQTVLVRDLATSGGCFQLALAPAGSGKTTAMQALTRAWQLSGGTVVGLAPSAAAASELATSIGQNADTVDKLVHELDRAAADPTHRPPSWVERIDNNTLIVIDEVSLASTTHLDRVLAFAMDRGASVRGVGDPAQRSSVAAGGVMRDVETTHGAVSLAEVMRFDDPTEGAASLALRAGDPTAIAHYLDRGRVHVGDAGTSLGAVYDGWAVDRARGVDAVMLAPLRDQVATLNIRARAERLTSLAAAGTAIGAEVVLANGQQASIGDVIQTRRNDRGLTLGATDFVRNGYRFVVARVADDGSLLARHLDTGRCVVLPAAYLAEHTELGYARTIAAAQGMTAGGTTTDAGVRVRVAGAAHVLVDPDVMDRESLYVAMTRGTSANHAYVVTAEVGDEHAVSRPSTVAPATAAELLAQVLERSSVQTSATSEAAAQLDPFRQLAPAVDRYADTLRVGAADLLGADAVEELTVQAERVVPRVTEAPAWPTLSGHLALVELEGRHRGQSGAALSALVTAVNARDLTGATDVAAVIEWRLAGDTSSLGPLPWLPAVPAALAADPTWGPYVAHLSGRIAQHGDGVAERVALWSRPGVEVPTWARPLVSARAHEQSLIRLATWRAAHNVDDTDVRPTGQPVLADAERAHQRELDRVAAGYGVNAAADALAMTPWADRFEPRLLDDSYWPQLASRLRAVERAGIDIAPLMSAALRDGGPLPDEQAAAALWWRLSRHLAPNLDVDALAGGGSARPEWSMQLDELVGPSEAEAVLTSAAWPALVARIDAAARDGLAPADLLADGLRAAVRSGVAPGDMTVAALWHVSLLADPEPLPFEELPPDPADLGAADPYDLGVDDPTQLVLDERGVDQLAHELPMADDLDRPAADPRNNLGETTPGWPEDAVVFEDGGPVVVERYANMLPAERVSALTVDLATARVALEALTNAVMTDRGPHVTAVMGQVCAMRQRADELAPLVADRDFALADWHIADAALTGAEMAFNGTRAQHLVNARTTLQSSPTPEELMAEQHLEHTRGAAQAAHDDLVAARTALVDAADGYPVTHQEATEVWRTAADLDLSTLNNLRGHVVAVQDDLWRAQATSERMVMTTMSPQTDAIRPLVDPDALDYGALTPSPDESLGQFVACPVDIEPER